MLRIQRVLKLEIIDVRVKIAPVVVAFLQFAAALREAVLEMLRYIELRFGLFATQHRRLGLLGLGLQHLLGRAQMAEVAALYFFVVA